MDNPHDFLRFIQVTRSQPQYGYVLSGIRKADLSDLAQHHYLVALTAWYLTKLVINAGGKLRMEKVLELALLHDLGEIFGGDIGMPYAKANKKAHTLAKKFEEENQRFLAEKLKTVGNIAPAFKEVMRPTTDEALVVKIADYLEVTHHKQYLRRLTEGDVVMVEKRMFDMVGACKNSRTRRYLGVFLKDWGQAVRSSGDQETFEFAKLL